MKKNRKQNSPAVRVLAAVLAGAMVFVIGLLIGLRHSASRQEAAAASQTAEQTLSSGPMPQAAPEETAAQPLSGTENPGPVQAGIGSEKSSILTPALFPDENFLSKLRLLYPEGLTAEEAKTVTVLKVPNSSISDLTGLSYFPNLEVLDISTNAITALDIGMMTNLKELNAMYNQISAFDFSGNRMLERLGIAYNRAPVLDLSACPGARCIDPIGEQVGYQYTGSISTILSYPAAAVKIADGRFTVDLSLLVGKENIGRVYLPEGYYPNSTYDGTTGILTFSVDESMIVDGHFTGYGSDNYTTGYYYDTGNPDFTWWVLFKVPQFVS